MKKTIGKRNKWSFTKVMALTLSAGILFTTPLQQGFAAKSTLLKETVVKQENTTINIAQGKGEIIEIKGEIAEILVGNGQVIVVDTIRSDALYVTGRELGNTNIIALDSLGNVIQKINIHVHFDTKSIKDIIHSVLPQEKDVNIEAVGERLMITGRVANPSVAGQIAQLVGYHAIDLQAAPAGSNPDDYIVNMMSVASEQQVMLSVKMLEIDRTILKELGLETSVNGSNPSGTQNFNFLPPPSEGDNGYFQNLVSALTGFSENPYARSALAIDSGIDALGFIEFAISALEREGLSNTLAEPNLTAISGEQAGFLAGGEFPIPTGRDRDGNITIEYKPFGVSLNFIPTVLSEDRISMQLDTEVSSLDFNQGITLAQVNVPGLNVRRAETTIEMASGSSLMIAGLMRSEAVKNLSGLPGIKDTPVLGDLVSSSSFERQETELLVIVTPILVEPFADNTRVVKKKSEPESTKLAMTFARNIRRIYGVKAPKMDEDQETFGYIID